MSTSADHAAQRGLAEKLGIEPGTVVQVLGADGEPPADQAVLDDVEARTENEVIHGDDSDEVADMVLLWWREDDGDLVDALMDAIGPLADDGTIWVLTPKTGREGHVEPSEIAEAVPTAGLAQTSSVSVGTEWSATRLVSPKSAKTKR